MSSADWWAKKLQDQQTPAPPARRQDIPVAPSQTPLTRFEQPVPTRDPAERAQSSRQTESCPECYSSNYMAVSNAAPRCYDCGYPLQQSGSKYGTLQGAHIEGSAKQARGNDMVNNYNPQEIIGRIDG
jgi:ribosomal protein L37AE/L43A